MSKKLLLSFLLGTLLLPGFKSPLFGKWSDTIRMCRQMGKYNSIAGYSKVTVLQDSSFVHFIATQLVSFDRPKIVVTGEEIDIPALIRKKDSALFLLDSVVNTEQFKVSVQNGSFTHKNGLSNQQIYDLFVSNNDKQKNIREHLTLVIDTTYLWNVTYQKQRHPSIGYDNQAGDSTVL